MKALSVLFLAFGCSIPCLIQAQFGPGVPVASGITDVQEILSADLDNDSYVDIMVRQPNAIGWFANDGAGNFASFDTIHVSQGVLGAFALGDTQGDELLDMMVSDADADAVLLLINNDAGGFDPPIVVFGLEGALPQAIAIADILGNSLPDLVVNTGTQIQGFVNVDGDYGIPPVILTEGTFNQGLYILDTDADGDRDVVTFVGLSGALTTLINPGTMVAPWLNGSAFGHILGGKRMRVVDVDGDGDLDLANATNHVMSWVDFEPGEDGIVAPQAVSGTTTSLYRTGWTIPLGCGAGASMLWTDSISEPVQWTTYDPLLEGFGPVSVLPDLPSFRAIRSGDVNGDAKEDLILWHDDNNLTWYPNTLEPIDVVLNLGFDLVAYNGPPEDLVGGSPEGGEYAINGIPVTVPDPELDPTDFPAGDTVLVSYRFVDGATGCAGVATDTVFVLLNVGIGSYQRGLPIKLIPNPTATTVRFFCPLPGVGRLMDGTGRIVKSFGQMKGNTVLDVSDAAPGIYLLSIDCKWITFYERLVIE